MKVYLDTLGCKLNQSEIETLARRFGQAGHRVVSTPQQADLCVVNTCTVTHVAARKSRQAIRRLHRANPASQIAAIGCYAEMEPDVLHRLPGVEWVVRNRDKAGLVEAVSHPRPLRPHPHTAPDVSPVPQSRTRALVKIQDGCDNACSYCIVRIARGPQRSQPPQRVLADIRAALAAGHREIVLTGVHIGAYGRDRWAAHAEHGQSELDLWGLVRRILDETELARLRLSSIEPWDIPLDRTFALWSDPRLCPHLHLPLQAGADRTLQRMGRRYGVDEYTRVVELARASIPDLAITTDVIVGFPGETHADFEASLRFVKETKFARVHVFPYSARAGTSAAILPQQIPSQVKSERAAAMRSVADGLARAFHQRFLGRKLEVLWERQRDTDAWDGLTRNYLRVHTTSQADLRNTLATARLDSLAQDGVRGTLVEESMADAGTLPLHPTHTDPRGPSCRLRLDMVQ
jgi:threonylcarbamoyladenosine tRNA methylthiotransferase MtaB